MRRHLHEPQMAQCDECGAVVPWVDATFLPFATLCGKEQCEVNARRKFDALPVEDDRQEVA